MAQPGPRPPSLGDDCQHQVTEQDPESGRTFCRHCGCEVPTQPVRIGTREIPVGEYMRRLTDKIRQLDMEGQVKQAELMQIQRKRDWMMSVAADFRDIRCAWPECDAAPNMRSQWCPLHKYEHEKVTARERQRKCRARKKNAETAAVTRDMTANA